MKLMMERPPCEWKECGKPAISHAYSRWLCGDHLLEIKEKLDKKREEFLLEE